MGKYEGLPFIDLRSQFLALEDTIRSRIEKVLRHGQFILGPEVQELEQKLAEFTGCKYAVSCSSGTDALLMTLMAYGLKKGEAVFTTPFTFIATAEVIALLGATPVFVDIDPETYNIDPDKLQQAVEKTSQQQKIKARGVIAVDLFGLPADYDHLTEIAGEYGLFLIEDAAQSFGALYKDRPAGALADAACTSFFPAKPLGCYGDGGAVFTDDPELAQELLSIRVHGQGDKRYVHRRIGVNGRLDTLQAAILLAKLDIFPQELDKRRQLAELYNRELSRQVPEVKIPKVPEGTQSAWAQYSIRLSLRQRVAETLRAERVPTNVYYELPLHLQPAFKDLGYKKGGLPVSEAVAEEIISLPMHPYLKEEQVLEITGLVARAIKNV